MLTKVHKWGNSLAVRIPKAFARDAQIVDDSLVEINLVAGKIIVTPVETPTWTLDQLIGRISKKNIHGEVDSGPATGNETW